MSTHLLKMGFTAGVRGGLISGKITPISPATQRVRIMTFSLENVVPWGRTLSEYRAMFALTDADLTRCILGCGDGPASFNAEAHAIGTVVVSCDPIYQFSAAEIEARVRDTYDKVIQGVKDNMHQFVWKHYESPDALGEIRLWAMRGFLADYQSKDAVGRYITAELPTLPFDDACFDLALCSHFLFLYSDHFDAAFHLASVKELCRVAKEVRIFPLLGLDAQPSPHLESVTAALITEGYQVEQIRVDYEFQVGGNHYLRVRHGS